MARRRDVSPYELGGNELVVPILNLLVSQCPYLYTRRYPSHLETINLNVGLGSVSGVT
jgi:hypothetical protein